MTIFSKPAGASLAVMVMAALISCASAPRVSAPISEHAATSQVGRQIYLVQLRAAPLAAYTGGIPGLVATNPQVTGASSLDLDSAASRAYRHYLETQQQQFIAAMNATLGRKVTPAFIYYYALNGMAVSLTPTEAARVAQLPNVLSVRADKANQVAVQAAAAPGQ